MLGNNPDGPENWENVEAMTNSATTGKIPRVINEWSSAERDESDRNAYDQVARTVTHHGYRAVDKEFVTNSSEIHAAIKRLQQTRLLHGPEMQKNRTSQRSKNSSCTE